MTGITFEEARHNIGIGYCAGTSTTGTNNINMDKEFYEIYGE